MTEDEYKKMMLECTIAGEPLADEILELIGNHFKGDINGLVAVPALLSIAGSIVFGFEPQVRQELMAFWLDTFKKYALQGTEN